MLPPLHQRIERQIFGNLWVMLPFALLNLAWSLFMFLNAAWSLELAILSSAVLFLAAGFHPSYPTLSSLVVYVVSVFHAVACLVGLAVVAVSPGVAFWSYDLLPNYPATLLYTAMAVVCLAHLSSEVASKVSTELRRFRSRS